jgi:hypothetical protein
VQSWLTWLTGRVDRGLTLAPWHVRYSACSQHFDRWVRGVALRVLVPSGLTGRAEFCALDFGTVGMIAGSAFIGTALWVLGACFGLGASVLARVLLVFRGSRSARRVGCCA